MVGLALASTRTFLWEHVSCFSSCRSGTYSQLGGSPWIEPLRTLLEQKDKPSWGSKQKGLLRTILAEGCWPLDRLRHAGYATDGLCVCGEPHTLFHILWICLLTREFREEYGLDDEILEKVSSHPHLALWYNGLLPDPTADLPLPVVVSVLSGLSTLTMVRSSVATGMGMDQEEGRSSRLRGGVDGQLLRPRLGMMASSGGTLRLTAPLPQAIRTCILLSCLLFSSTSATPPL